MKNSKKKIVVSLMGLTMGAALVGSVSGSVAWYQYSTRATATIEGVSAGSSRNLQMRLGSEGEWGNNITAAQIKEYLEVGGSGQPTNIGLRPATIHTNTATTEPTYDKDAALSVANFKKQPETRGQAFTTTTQFEGSGTNKTFYWIQIPFQFRVIDNGDTTTLAEKNVYLVDADVSNTGTSDIAKALRFHISDGNSNHALFADQATNTTISGTLDINGNNKADTNGWAEDDSTGKPYNYCNESHMADEDYDSTGEPAVYTLKASSILKQDSYNLTTDGTVQDEGDGKLLAKDNDLRAFVGGKVLGKTLSSNSSFLTLTLTMWLEGWELVSDLEGTSGTAVWDPTTYIAQNFSAAFRFAVNTAEGNDA